MKPKKKVADSKSGHSSWSRGMNSNDRILLIYKNKLGYQRETGFPELLPKTPFTLDFTGQNAWTSILSQ